MSRFFLLIFLIIFNCTSVFSLEIKGTVVDYKSNEPLPFVHITYGESNFGATTNIDGNFSLSLSPEIDKLFISYLGYQTDTILISEINKGELIVKLKSKLYNLEEVVVLPGENPAHRIINKVIENKDLNNPEKMKSFSYKSYNKMIFTVEKDTVGLPDSLKIRESKVVKKFDDHHLLILETINKKEFLQPDKYNEEIIASKVSGFTDPIFSLIASQVQSFSFYNDYFTLLDKSYLNPISKGSTKRYLFLLEDTLFTENNDTVFIISYRPRKGKTFDGLKGFLHINTNTYAIQSVVAAPLGKDQGMGISIQQNYQYLNNEQWFPKELTTQIVWEKAISSNPFNYNIVANGKSYIDNIVLNPELRKRNFSNVEIKIAEDANKKTSEYWNENRNKSLSEIEQETYRIIDSISKAGNLEKKLSGFETFMNGNIPYKFLDFPLNKLMDYNYYEGYRLGLGLMTNKKVSKYFSIGGYFGYGFKDEDWKYGGDLILNLHQDSESKLHFSYINDLSEKSGYNFLEKLDLTSTELFRKYMIDNMDLVEKYQVSFSTLMLKYLRVNVFLNQSYVTSTDNYTFGQTLANSTNEFGFSEIGMQFRYAYNEKFMQTLRAKYSLGTNYPIVFGNITRGTNWFDGDYEYTKIEAKITKTFKTKTLGKTKVTVVGGLVDGNIPISKLYNGHGSYQSFSLEAENSFGTMRMGEFYSDKFFSVFFKHDFGYLFKTKFLSPKFAVINNYGISTLSEKEYHFDSVELKSYDKGYYECGVLFNNILNQSFIGYGLGIFYRYGPYAFNKTEDNISYKLSFTIGL